VISNQGGYYATFAYVSEARRMGLAILPPDVNASERVYTGSGREVRVGLMQLKGLRREALDALLAERTRAGAFRSFADLRARVALRTSDAELLVKAGALDSIAGGRTRPELLWELCLDGRATEPAPELFEAPPVAAPRAPAYDRATVLRHEVETLGFLLSAHPLEPYERALRGRGVIAARDLDRHAGRRVRILGWHVNSKLVQTKDKEPMEFLSFEDTTAIYDATLFPDAYRRFCHLLTSTRPFLLSGLVEEDCGVCTLTVEKVERL
jgi:error-prone DNA polymerase